MKKTSRTALSIASIAAVGAIVILYILSRDNETPVEQAEGEKTIFGSGFRHLSQGSESYPYAWFEVLEQADSERPFREGLERYGLFSSPKSAENPLGLPAGLSVSRNRGVRVLKIGMTCGACHSNKIEYQGKSLLIDGAPSLFDPDTFFGDLAAATLVTLHDPPKRFRFLKNYLNGETALGRILASYNSHDEMRLIGGLEEAVLNELNVLIGDLIDRLNKEFGIRNADSSRSGIAFRKGENPDNFSPRDYVRHFENHAILDLEGAAGSFLSGLATKAARRTHLSKAFDEFAADLRITYASIKFLQNFAVAEGGPTSAAGPGRVDAFGKVRNLILPLIYGPEVEAPMTAPVSFPPLWGIKSKKWLHWNANTDSVMQRNLLEALGSGAMLDTIDFDVTANFENLYALEQMTDAFEPPPWPEDLFAPIDRDRAERGRRIYDGEEGRWDESNRKYCAACHGVVEKVDDGLEVYPMFSLEAIGVDPNHATNFNQPVPGAGAFPQILSDLSRKAIERYASVYGVSTQKLQSWSDGRPAARWRSPIEAPLAAGPLKGIWATAPYLHNGSVPTLYHLLLPGDERPKKFPLGHREYDPAHVGYRMDAPDAPFVFDVDRPTKDAAGKQYADDPNGNSNRGHEFGTHLSEEERLDLIEYMKTL